MNDFKANLDTSGFDPFGWRVVEETSDGSRLLCRCETRRAAERIARALNGVTSNPIEAASSDTDVLGKIDQALKLIEDITHKPTPTAPDKPKPDKIRIVL